jgi:nucleotide-binding universal stress UspA family protein
MTRYRRILHASDFSPASAPAFARAVAAARKDRAELILVHVMGPVIPAIADGYMAPHVYEDLDRAARRQAQKQLDRLAGKARTAGVRVTTLLREGSPAEHRARRTVEARGRRSDGNPRPDGPASTVPRQRRRARGGGGAVPGLDRPGQAHSTVRSRSSRKEDRPWNGS